MAFYLPQLDTQKQRGKQKRKQKIKGQNGDPRRKHSKLFGEKNPETNTGIVMARVNTD